METLDIADLQPAAGTIEALVAAETAVRHERARIAVAQRDLSARRAALVLDGDTAGIAALEADRVTLPDRAVRVEALAASIATLLRDLRYARAIERQRERIAEAEAKKRAFADAVLREYPALAERIVAIHRLGKEADAAIAEASKAPDTREGSEFHGVAPIRMDAPLPIGRDETLPALVIGFTGDWILCTHSENQHSVPEKLQLPGYAKKTLDRNDACFAPPPPMGPRVVEEYRPPSVAPPPLVSFASELRRDRPGLVHSTDGRSRPVVNGVRRPW